VRRGTGMCPRCAVGDVLRSVAAGEGASPGRELGSYVLLDEIGRGGMGRVWRARQRGMDREVAVKTLWGGVGADPRARERFQREAEAIGRIHHPGIVVVHEIGEQDGELFLAMELVEGMTLADRLSVGALPEKDAASMLRELADAVSHAHEAGVVHRDLKPSNVFLDTRRGAAPRLGDFGLARLTAADAQRLTLSQDRTGTPAYLAPEQALGEGSGQDERIDVYGLGAVLYHALTGRAPFVGETVEAVIRAVVEREPIPPRSLMAGVSRDLETICLKCLNKEPARRYRSAREVRLELDRFLRGESIEARPPGPAGRLVAWARRRPLVAGLCVAVLGGLGLSWIQWYRAGKAGEALARQLSVAENSRISALFDARQTLDAVGGLARILRRDPSDVVAANRLESALIHRTWPTLLGLLPGPGVGLEQMAWGSATELYGFDTSGRVHSWSIADGSRRGWEWETGAGGIKWMGASADGRWMGVLRRDGHCAIASTTDASVRFSFSSRTRAVQRMAFDPATNRLALVQSQRVVEVHRYGERAERIWRWEASAPLTGLAWSPDGTKLAGVSNDGRIHLWDPETGTVGQAPMRESFAPIGVSWHPNGRLLAVSTRDGGVGIWDVVSGRREDSRRNGIEHPARFNGDGLLLRYMSDAQTLVAEDLDGGRERSRLTGLGILSGGWLGSRDMASGLFAGSGRSLVSVDLNGTGYRREPIWTDGSMEVLAVSPDGGRLAVGTGAGDIQIWDVGSRSPQSHHFRLEEKVIALRFISHSAGVWMVLSDGAAICRTYANGLSYYRVPLPVRAPVQAALSDDCGLVALADPAGTVQVFETVHGQLQAGPWEHPSKVLALKFSPDRRWLGVVTEDGAGRVHRLEVPEATGGSVQVSSNAPVLKAGSAVIFSDIAFSRTSEWVATSVGNRVGCCRVSGSGSRHTWDHPAPVMSVEFDPSSRRLVTACRDGVVRMWDIETGELQGSGFRHDAAATDARFSPDGALVASVGTDRSLRIWDSGKGRLRALAGGLVALREVTFDRKGGRLAVAGDRMRGALLDVGTGLAISESLPTVNVSDHVQFSPDGEWLARWTDRGRAYLYPVPEARLPVPEAIVDLAEMLAGERYGPDGEVQPILIGERVRWQEAMRSEMRTRPAAATDPWAGILRHFVPPDPRMTNSRTNPAPEE